MGENGELSGFGWWVWARNSTIFAVVVALVFGVWGYLETNRHCGVVRLYEQIFGAFIIFIWFLLAVIGLKICSVGCVKGSQHFMIAGGLLAMVADFSFFVISVRISYGLFFLNQP
jgi:hypothetical protein